MSSVEQLEFLKGQYNNVVGGRAKYSDRQGGELKAMTNTKTLPRQIVGNSPQVQDQKEGQKRKRDADSPEDTEAEDSARDKKAKLFPGYFDGDNEDDDEELPPYVKIEVDAMDQAPIFPEPAISDSQQRRPVQSQSDEQISASISNLGITEKVGTDGHNLNPADQKHEIPGAAKSDPTTLTASAEDLKRDLLGHSDEWMSYAGSHGLALMGFAARLRMAAEVDQMLVARRNILQWLNSYCEHIGTMKLTQQQSLVDARGSGIHGDIVQAYESLVETYQEKEKELRVVFEKMKQRVEVLHTGLNFS